jgi:tRNA-modifying protein YgfZ
MNVQTLLQSPPTINYLNEINDTTTPVAIALPCFSVIEVAGEEAESFLQNLLTNDIRTLTANTAQLSGFCNPKGRLLSLFYVIKREQDFLLVLAADLTESIAQRLNMFKLRSKVDITVSPELKVMGYLIQAALTNQPSNFWSGVSANGQISIYLPGNIHRYLTIVSAETNIDDSHIGAENLWTSADIQAGLPMVYLQSKEQFTPQQLNLDVVGGVSFKKGCYPGQEVVARLHYLGKPSRRLFLAQLKTTEIPEPNIEVTDESGEVAGHVVRAAMLNSDTLICQLSLKLAAKDKKLFINNNEVSGLTALVENEE